MKAKDVIGRKIVRIDQQRFVNPNTGRPCWHVSAIHLEGGVTLKITTIETPGDYAHDLSVHKTETFHE